jgi:hypothetical protein
MKVLDVAQENSIDGREATRSCRDYTRSHQKGIYLDAGSLTAFEGLPRTDRNWFVVAAYAITVAQ